MAKRIILIVLDSVGIGEAPDAADYGDTGSATLHHLAEHVGGIKVPVLQEMGLGNIPPIIGKPPVAGVSEVETPTASYGAMQEVSEGKDTITGHWEIVGLPMNPGFKVFEQDFPSFPEELVEKFVASTGREIIGNCAASGTAIIEKHGKEHMETGKWIAYTSADSVFQIAAHTNIVPIEELYKACEIARKLCDPYTVGRVIARPFIGEPGAFERTKQRKDYAFSPTEKTILERCIAGGVPVYAVGKIEDIVAHRGITESIHSGDTAESQVAVDHFTDTFNHGFIFANYIDFDMIYGHRRDPEGYARAIEQTDGWLKGYIEKLTKEDILIITADHGNDPTFPGTDHTREYVPLLVYQKGAEARNLGLRNGFYDIAQSIASNFGLEPTTYGKSFL